MFKYISGLIVVLITVYMLWMYYTKIECISGKNKEMRKKDITYELLHKKYNMTKQITIYNPIKKLPHGFVYPVVLKPTDGSLGKHVYTDINDNDELLSISKKLLKNNKMIILENQIQNMRECRVLIHKKLNHISITERLPITVIGDGIHTIKELVTAKNKMKMNMKNSNNDYHRIIIDDRIVDKNNIPYKNETVLVNNRKNSSLGGDIRLIDIKDVHPDNIQLFNDILFDINSNFNGLDIMFCDLSVSHKKRPIILLETNFCPGLNKKRIYKKEFKTVRHSLYKILFGSTILYTLIFKHYIRQ